MARRRGRRIARGQYRYTPKRQMALRKAQMISARKRKGLSRGQKVGITAGVATAAVLGATIARHKISGSSLDIQFRRNGPHGASHTVERSPAQEHPRYTFSHGGQHYNARGRVLTPFDPRHVVRAGHRGVGGMTLTYRHKTMTGEQAKNAIFGRKIGSGGAPPQANSANVPYTPSRRMTQADKDAIPYVNTKTSKGWPHVGAKKAREQNEGVRAGTHYVGPAGVKPYPKNPKKRAVLQEKSMRYMMGLGFTVTGEEHVTWKNG